MEIKPIRREMDYDAALRRIEALWGAAEGTPEGDELNILVTLAEAYEREHFPVDLPDPIEAIKFRLVAGEVSATGCSIWWFPRTSAILPVVSHSLQLAGLSTHRRIHET
jgi:hypothetical protein